MRTSKLWVMLIVLLLAGLWWYQLSHRPNALSSVPAPGLGAAVQDGQSPTSIDPSVLPPEARTTLQLIAHGGPFPHRQDGEVFGNYEHLLPEHVHGYYHEYTVETPGADTRGTRRIITGGTPPQVYYYTDDHYHSFHQLRMSQGS